MACRETNYLDRSFAVSIEDPLGDFNDYLSSLHLPANVYEEYSEFTAGDGYIAGKDRPGDYRDTGVAYGWDCASAFERNSLRI